jgi:hypothetical protein
MGRWGFRTTARIIDFGGFLGVGNRKIAVDWNALHFATTATKDDQITLDLTRDQAKAAPEYKEGRPLGESIRIRVSAISRRMSSWLKG